MNQQLQPVTLSGKYVKLVPLDRAHHAALCEIGLDEELWRFTTNEITTPEEMHLYIESALKDQSTGASLPFTIIEQNSNKLVGSSRYHSFNASNRRVVIGHTWIGRDWQRTVVNTETKYLMLKYAFDILQCLRVEFIVNSINEKSRRALLRIGATQEAILRNYVIGKSDEPCDVALFSIINAEWPRIKVDLEQKSQ